MNMINGGLNLLFLLLSIAIFGMSAWALGHAAQTPGQAFPAAGKLKKNLWLLILALATLFSAGGGWSYFQAFLFFGGEQFIGLSAIGIFSIVSVIAATIYLVDVKPAVKGLGRGGNNGPYGPW
ncbi:DUF2516 family protein [Nonomuraea sp. NPDC046570]|uniref:DUF2516 family protein n=1 Tax=Nonomuraea sp. NPDC046570 TaxID=3155255 RepID=UPI0033D9FA45